MFEIYKICAILFTFKLGQANSSPTSKKLNDHPSTDFNVPITRSMACGSIRSLLVDENGEVHDCDEIGCEVVGLNEPIVSVSASGYCSYFLGVNGNAWSCDSNGQWDNGMIDNTRTNDGVLHKIPLTNITSIFATPAGCFFIAQNKEIYAIGRNDSRQLGLPKTANMVSAPTKIDIPPIYFIFGNNVATNFIDTYGNVWETDYHGDKPRCIVQCQPMRNGIRTNTSTRICITTDGKMQEIVGSYGQLMPHHPYLPPIDKICASDNSQTFIYLDCEGKVWVRGEWDILTRFSYFEEPTKVEELHDIVDIAISDSGNYALFLNENGELWTCGESPLGKLPVSTNSGWNKLMKCNLSFPVKTGYLRQKTKSARSVYCE